MKNIALILTLVFITALTGGCQQPAGLCPNGGNQVQLPDGTWGCPNTSVTTNDAPNINPQFSGYIMADDIAYITEVQQGQGPCAIDQDFDLIWDLNYTSGQPDRGYLIVTIRFWRPLADGAVMMALFPEFAAVSKTLLQEDINAALPSESQPVKLRVYKATYEGTGIERPLAYLSVIGNPYVLKPQVNPNGIKTCYMVNAMDTN